MREAVELCKLLEVVVPEAGFHIALTGGLLYKEGRRKDCDLMFYQIRQMEPNYEVLWKYLSVAGVLRSPDYPDNGWLVKATYRGKAVDCLFPNAKKAKKVGATDCYKAAAAPPSTPPDLNTAVGSEAYPFPPPLPPTPPAPSVTGLLSDLDRHLADLDAEALVRHNVEAARRIAGQNEPTPPPVVDYIDRSFAAQRRIREERRAEAAIDAAAEAQDDIPF